MEEVLPAGETEEQVTMEDLVELPEPSQDLAQLKSQQEEPEIQHEKPDEPEREDPSLKYKVLVIRSSLFGQILCPSGLKVTLSFLW